MNTIVLNPEKAVVSNKDMLPLIFANFSPKNLFLARKVCKLWKKTADAFLNLLENPRGIDRPIYTRAEFIEKLKNCLAMLQPGQNFHLDAVLLKSIPRANFQPNSDLPPFPSSNAEPVVVDQMYSPNPKMLEISSSRLAQIVSNFSSTLTPRSSLSENPPITLKILVDEISAPISHLRMASETGMLKIIGTDGRSYTNRTEASNNYYASGNNKISTKMEYICTQVSIDLAEEVEDIISQIQKKVSRFPNTAVGTKTAITVKLATILVAAGTLYILMHILSQLTQSNGPSNQDL